MRIPVDPAASLRMAEIHVDIGGTIYTMPRRSAADWIEATWEQDGTYFAYVPGLLLVEDRETIGEALLRGELDPMVVREAAWDAIAVGTGVEWWWVGHRLLHTIAEAWTQVGAPLVGSGFQPEHQPIGALIGAVIGQIQQNLAAKEPAERQQIIAALCMPPTELPNYRQMMQVVGAATLADMGND